MKELQLRSKTRWPRLALASSIIFAGGAVLAAEPCPWEGTDKSDACAQWDTMAKELEAAKEKAEAAQEKLEAIAETAQATVASPEEARARAIIDRILEMYTSPAPEVGFEFERNYTISRSGDTYTAQLPTFDLVIEDNRIGFGPITFSVTPGEKGLSTVDYRMGDAITVSEGNTTIAKLNIGEQIGQGIWDDNLKYFASAQGRLGNLSLDIADAPVEAKLGGIDYDLNLNRNDDDTWHYEQSFTLADLAVSGEGNSLNLAGISGNFAMDGRNYAKLLDITDKLQSMVGEMEQIEQNDPEAIKPFLDTIGEVYDSFSKFDARLAVNNLGISQGEQSLGGFDSLSFGNAFSESDKGSRFSYSLELSGLQTPLAPVPPQLLPSDARIEIGLKNIPPNMFSRFVEMGMESEKLSEQEQEAYWNQKLLELLMSSELGLFIKDTFITAQAARIDLSLNANVAQNSAMGGTGDFLLRIEGLQNIVDGAGLAENQDVAPVLAMLTAFSNRTEEDGKVIDTFDLKFTPEGKVMLNNKDITAMIMPGATQPQ